MPGPLTQKVDLLNNNPSFSLTGGKSSSIFTQSGYNTQITGGLSNNQPAQKPSLKTGDDRYDKAVKKINTCLPSNVQLSEISIKALINTAYGEIDESDIDEEFIDNATDLIIRTISYLKNKHEEVNFFNILSNISEVRLAQATDVAPGSILQGENLSTRLQTIMDNSNCSKEDALKELLRQVMNMHNSTDETLKFEADMNWYTIIKGSTKEELAMVQEVLTQLSKEDPEFQTYAKSYLEKVQYEMLARGGTDVADNIDAVRTFSPEEAANAERTAAHMRSDEGAKDAAIRLDDDASQLYAIREKLVNNEPLTEEDYQLLNTFNINRDSEITPEVVQGVIDGLLTDLQTNQTYGTACNENVNRDTLELVMYYNTRHENGDAVLRGVETLVQENPDVLTLPVSEFLQELENIIGNVPSCLESGNPSDSTTGSNSPDTNNGSGSGNVAHQSTPGSLGFEQNFTAPPQQTMNPRDFYPNAGEQDQITLVKPQKGEGLDAILRNHTGNLSEIIDKHIKDNGVMGFVREALNCKGAMVIKYVRDKVLQLFNSMTTSLRINMFNSVLNNESSTILLSELDNNELNSVKAQNSYVKSQIDLAKKYREEQQGTCLT